MIMIYNSALRANVIIQKAGKSLHPITFRDKVL